MAINGVDPAAKSPGRIRRNWNRAIKGSITATIETVTPVTLDAQNRLIINISSTGGINNATASLQIKLPANSGLATSASGLIVVVPATAGLQLGGTGLTVKLNAAGAITVDANGLAVATDGTTIEISTNQIRIKNASVTGAKFGWASAKGDLLVFDGSSYIRLPVGADGQVLTADSLAAAGVKWA